MITRNRTLIVLTLAAVAMAVFAGPAQAAPEGELGILTPGTLAGNNPATGAPWANGDTYRFAFITSTMQGAESSDITTYNALVQGLADATTAYDIGADEGVTWKVIGSTADVDAIDNTSTTWTDESPGSPIFLLDGSTLIASDYKDLWDGEIQHIINLTEQGVEFAHWPFTGTYTDGTNATGKPDSGGGALGASDQVVQGNGSVTTDWIWRMWTADPAATLLPLYALSDPLVILAEPGQAFDPNPADEATDVVRDVVLGWNPGVTAATRDVYFGETFDDVNSATTSSALYRGSQVETTFAPGRLKFGQPYFWRIDEVNAPPDSTIFRGSVWSFTVELLAYPIENVTVTASSSNVGEEAENTVNGSGLDANDLHSVETTEMWRSSADGDGPAWIEYEFDRVSKLHEMWVWNHNSSLEQIYGFGFKDVLIEYSADGIDYKALGTTHEFAQASGTPGYAHETTIDFDGAAAKYVRLTANSTWGSPLGGLSEVRFFRIPVHAKEPYPDSGATDVDPDVVLGWEAGRGVVSHDVYVSTDPNALTLAGPVTEPVFDTASLDLELGQIYHWRVDEVNDAETTTTWQGDIWSFSTPEYLVVDDFESYNDIDDLADPESNRIFESWPDGWGVATNGALIGNDPANPSYAETTIVHGGDQSMPMFYSNTLDATYSEGTHTFADPQDWTASGIKTLALAFHGTLGNTGKLYVKINNTKVTYDLDASHIAIAQWQAWNIDLSLVDAGLLQSVTDLTIGVEGAGAIGTLYIDDIGLYPKAGELMIPVDPSTNGLVGAWNFDEGSGTVATDSSGNGLNGTIVDAAWDTGIQGSALLFNGVSSYVNIDGFKGINADRTDPNFPIQNPFTVAKWIKTSAEEGSLLTWGTHAGRQRLGWRINGGTLRIEHQAGALRGNTPVNDDEWHHVALVVSEGANLRPPATLLYLDGQPDSTFQGSGNPFELTADVDAAIGMRATKGDRFFTGLIDEVVIYDRALTGEELLWLADRTTPIHKPL